MKAFFRTFLYIPLYNIFVFLVAVIPGNNLGVAIIALTALVRLALTPTKYKSLESQMKQREIQPDLKRIQEKYKDDRQAQSMAMMQLYKEKGVNPASGCLPLLVQFPILIILFHIFRGHIESDYHLLYSFVQAPETINRTFLWVKDLTKPDPYFIFPVLAGVSQFFFSRSLMASTPQTGSPDDVANIMTKQMLYLAPIMTIVIGYRLAAALSLYWMAGSLMDWYQQNLGMKRFKSKKGSSTTVSVRRRQKETHS